MGYAAWPRKSRVIKGTTAVPSRARRSLPPGNGVGLADGTVRLSPPARVPGSQGSYDLSRTARKTNHIAWPRDTERDLRRRRTIYTPWMHRPSLDRGRNLESLASDHRLELQLVRPNV